MDAPLHIGIIGAGLIGLSCADSLRKRGVRVSMFDRREGAVLGTSYSNSGMIHPSQSRSWAFDIADTDSAAKAVFELANRSRDLLQENMAELGLTDMASRPSGCAQVFDSAEMMQAYRDDYAALGVPCKTLTPETAMFGMEGLFFAGDISGNSRDYGRALADDLARRGAAFHYGCGGIELSQKESGLTVKYDGQSILLDHIIIAAGAQSAGLLAQFGLTVAIDSVRGFALNYHRPDVELPAHNLPTCPVMDAASRSALSVFGDTVRLAGGWDIDSPDPIITRWQEIAPDLMAALGEPYEIWEGQRPVSRLGRPFICAAGVGGFRVEGLWLNSGHGHNGWTLSAGSGELMAQMILGGHEDMRFGFEG